MAGFPQIQTIKIQSPNKIQNLKCQTPKEIQLTE
jgi:hypothetical protein